MIRINHHDDVIKWNLFPRYWPFLWGIHRSPMNSPHKGQWHRALMLSLICAWINICVSNRWAGDLRGHRAQYDVILIIYVWKHPLFSHLAWLYVNTSFIIHIPDQTVYYVSMDAWGRHKDIMNELLRVMIVEPLSPPTTVANVLTFQPWPFRQKRIGTTRAEQIPARHCAPITARSSTIGLLTSGSGA